MAKLKRIYWEITEVYGSVSNWVYNKFERRCRSKAQTIYYDKLIMAFDHNISLNWDQDRLMWSEAMDTVLNRPVNKAILKVLEAWDK